MSMKHPVKYHLRAAKLRRKNEQRKKAEKQASRRLQEEIAGKRSAGEPEKQRG